FRNIHPDEDHAGHAIDRARIRRDEHAAGDDATPARSDGLLVGTAGATRFWRLSALGVLSLGTRVGRRRAASAVQLWRLGDAFALAARLPLCVADRSIGLAHRERRAHAAGRRAGVGGSRLAALGCGWKKAG